MRLRIAFLMILTAFWCVVVAHACDVPVFRYALENWPADRYQLTVFVAGKLPEDRQAAHDKIENAIEQDGLNGDLTVVDINQPMTQDYQALWESCRGNFEPPILSIEPPYNTYGLGLRWSGPLAETTVDSALNSPLRSEVARRLLAGEAGVWILLESGDATRDDEAFKTLETTLAAINKQVREDIGQTSDGVSVETDPFSVLRLSRDNAEEVALRDNLLAVEPDLTELDEPMAFPVFGRGRVLYALVGPGIHEVNIEESCGFLFGPCSCVVKDGNPGVDLLMNVDWESFDAPPVSLPEEQPEVEALMDQHVEEVMAEVAPPSGVPYILGGIVILLLIVSAFTVLIMRRRAS